MLSFLKLSIIPPLTALVVLAGSCVKVQPPTDTGDSLFAGPSSPTPNTPGVLAYDPDMKPLFASDCVLCHSASRADGNYRMDTYAEVIREARSLSATSGLVMTAQPGNRMYPYWSGSDATRRAKAATVLSWVVTYRAQEKR